MWSRYFTEGKTGADYFVGLIVWFSSSMTITCVLAGLLMNLTGFIGPLAVFAWFLFFLLVQVANWKKEVLAMLKRLVR
ncbi:hypothetical protein SE17_08290 [Kouleothrix aurantiaca]|jgi:hypothetical protein|uniref:Uncharacterized protein n=1 Tax=Kouleothrix aurantiaca TaxID=186479 RepID=A0A0P9DJK9_9CHLR|nr:hypothetical protein SE17_08290 [Kouleothrix aurantiaca]